MEIQGTPRGTPPPAPVGCCASRDYAERLIDELEPLDWPESIKLLQRNWIGKSEGAEVDFTLDGETITVYTTRPDTLFGATYMVLSPEHPLVDTVTTPEQKHAVEQYRAQCASKSDLERTDLSKEKTGVFTGAYAVNPVNGKQIPVWIADYVLMGYGTGAIMAVPAHDERDFAFAQVFGLPILQVVQPPSEDTDWRGFCGYEGSSVNSGFLTGLPTLEAKEKMILWLEENGKGRRKVNYKLQRLALLPASVTGGNHSPSYGKTVTTAPCRKANSPYSSRIWTTSPPRETPAARWSRLRNG